MMASGGTDATYALDSRRQTGGLRHRRRSRLPLSVTQVDRIAPVVVAIAGSVSWWVTGAAAAVPVAFVGWVAASAAVCDLRTGRIPNALVLWALVVLAGSWPLVSIVDNRPMVPLVADLAGGWAMSGAPAMFVVWLVAPRLLGGGDWKLLSVLGFAIGYVAPLGATIIVMGAFAVGLGVAAIQRRREIVLGPPMAFGYAAAVTAVIAFPELFLNWYRLGNG